MLSREGSEIERMLREEREGGKLQGASNPQYRRKVHLHHRQREFTHYHLAPHVLLSIFTTPSSIQLDTLL